MLLEMCADNTAARRHGPRSHLCGLVTLSGGTQAAVPILAAADTAVLARASRLTAPAGRSLRFRDGLNLSAAMGLTQATPVLAGLLCHH